MIQVAVGILASGDLLVDLSSDFCVALGLLLNQSEHVELSETFLLLESINNLNALLKGIWSASWANE